MNKKLNLYVFFVILLVIYPLYIFHEVIWRFMDKIGALATGFALFAIIYQGYVARKALTLTREANSQNLFQQKFNLVLEQHNDSLARVRDWLKSNKYLDRSVTTESLVGEIRGHEQLSPYMRILYHTLKSIKEELPITEETDHNGVIKNQKRYTSLVRSFIPNDILFLVACNASVIGDEIFKINNSKSYSYYNALLQDFDFFEHLKTLEDEKINLGKFIEEIVYSIYESCYLYYFTEHADSNTPPSIMKLKAFLSKPSFFICLAYNLKDKAIDTSDFPQKSLSINEMLILSINEHIEKLNEEELDTYISHKTNEFYKEMIKKIIYKHYHLYTNVSYLSTTSTKGLYNPTKIIEFFSSYMHYDNPINDLLIFRDDFHSTLKSLILNSSSFYKNNNFYEYSVKKSYEGIIKEISPLIDKLIKFRHKIRYTELPSEVLKNKKEELLRYIANFSNQL